jgi:hypothetical protein
MNGPAPNNKLWCPFHDVLQLFPALPEFSTVMGGAKVTTDAASEAWTQSVDAYAVEADPDHPSWIGTEELGAFLVATPQFSR